MGRKLVIIGAGEFATIAYEYFSVDTDYEIVGFAVEPEYIKEPTLNGLPVVPLDTVDTHFPPAEVEAFVAVTYTKLNRIRKRFYETAKEKGYRFASYISPRAFVWRTAVIGENVFIFENNVIQHGCVIGDNVVLWSGNHIGHQSRIEPHCYLSSHVVVSGYCEIGSCTFIGVNTTVADNIKIGKDNFIAAGALVNKNTEDGAICKGPEMEVAKIDAYRFLKVPR